LESMFALTILEKVYTIKLYANYNLWEATV
jgi:hypothetical protein